MDNIFNRNIVIKVASILVAVILWFAAIREQNPEISRRYDNIPVQLENEEQLNRRGLTLVRNLDTRTVVHVRGRAQDFARVDVDELTVFVDLSRVTKEGEQNIPAEVRGLPQGIIPQRAPEIFAIIDVLTSKDVPLVLETSISVGEGFQAHQYNLTPANNIRVLGPASILNRIYRAGVSLNVQNVTTTIQRSLTVNLFDENDQIVELEYVKPIPNHVIVTVPVYPVRSLPVQPAIVGVPAEGYEVQSVEMYPREIIMNGDGLVLYAMQNVGTEVVDIQGASADVRRTVRLQDYQGVQAGPAQPTWVEVIVRISEIIIEINFSEVEIEIQNPPQNQRVSLSSDYAEITLRGPQLMVAGLNAEDIRVYVNAEGVSAGENTVPLNVEVPPGIELGSVNPKEVTVTVN